MREIIFKGSIWVHCRVHRQFLKGKFAFLDDVASTTLKGRKRRKYYQIRVFMTLRFDLHHVKRDFRQTSTTLICLRICDKLPRLFISHKIYKFNMETGKVLIKWHK